MCPRFSTRPCPYHCLSISPLLSPYISSNITHFIISSTHSYNEGHKDDDGEGGCGGGGGCGGTTGRGGDGTGGGGGDDDDDEDDDVG